MLLLGALGVGLLQPTAQAATQAEFDAAYEAVLNNPENLQGVLDLARIAIELGEYEIAVGALERVMLSASDIPSVRADLGFLYYRLGSLEIARFHLSEALASGQLSPELEARTRDLIGKSESGVERSSIRGAVSFGMRYQTNPGSAADTDRILAGGTPVTLAAAGDDDDDIDVFVLGRATHRYDLLTQNRAAIETGMRVLADRYFDQSTLHTYLAEVSPGIRFEPDPVDNKGFSLRPHVVARVVVRDEDLLSHDLGVGLDLRYAASETLYTEAVVQHRIRDFHNSTDRPNVSDRDGHETLAAVNARYRLRNDVFLAGGVRVVNREADRGFHGNFEYAANARISFSYKVPLLGMARGVDSYLGGGFREVRFDDPDPTVDPVNTRNDHEFRVVVGSSVALNPDWSMALEASQTFVQSNIRNFDRDNFTVGLTATRRF